MFICPYRDLLSKITYIFWFPSVFLSFSNLRTVMYQETIQDGHFKVVAVVNPNLTAASMSELENKKACFPEFAGLGKNHIIFKTYLNS